MNVREAMSVLGVHEGFKAEDVDIAFKRGIKLSHPDVGGTGDTSRVVKARDVLVKALGIECRACKGKGAVGGFKCKPCNGRGK